MTTYLTINLDTGEVLHESPAYATASAARTAAGEAAKKLLTWERGESFWVAREANDILTLQL